MKTSEPLFEKQIPVKSKVIVLDKNFNSEFHFAKCEMAGEMFVSHAVDNVKFFVGEGYSTRADKMSWYALAVTNNGMIYAMSKGSDSKADVERVVKQTQNTSGHPFYEGAKALWKDNTKNELALKKGKPLVL